MGRRAIVIGTGAGGLTAASRLAREGFEVTALEAAKQLGGYLNPFARKRYHFDPGVHYMGQCGPGEMVDRVLRGAGVNTEGLWCAMDPDGFDVIRFPGFEIRFPAGIENFRDRVAEAFPQDTRDLDRFLKEAHAVDAAMAAVTRLKPRLRTLSAMRFLPALARWSKVTYGEMLESLVGNPRLRAVLAAQCGDYGLPPSKAPATLGLGVLNHFADGGWFPRGGSGTLRDALVAAGEANGATYRRRAPVARIRTHQGRVVGVTLASGEQLDCDVIVSAIDPTLTFGELLDADVAPPKLKEKAARTQSSAGSVCVFLGLERDLRDYGLGAFNVWDYPGWDLDAYYGDIANGKMPSEWPFFLSPNSLKDSSGAMAPAGCSTLEVVTLAPYAPFERWAGTPSFKRGQDYVDFKNQIADSLLEAVDRRWPGLVGDVAVKDIATPLTNQHFAGAVRGAAYGPAALPEQFGARAYRPWTPIGGLFLAGAGVLGPGVAPCLASGLMAARIASTATRVRSFFPSARALPAPFRPAHT